MYQPFSFAADDLCISEPPMYPSTKHSKQPRLQTGYSVLLFTAIMKVPSNGVHVELIDTGISALISCPRFEVS